MTRLSILKLTRTPARIFSGLSSFQILAMFRRGLFYTYLSLYMIEFLNLSNFEATLYATLPMIMSIIFQNFVWGPISDKIQRRRTLIVLGEILAGTGTLVVWGIHFLFSFNSLYISGYVIIIGFSFVEMFWSMSNIGWTALISDLYPSEKRSKIMGRLTGLGGMGRMVGIFIGGVLYNGGYGFRNGPLFFVASSFMFISTIPMLLFSPEGGIIKEDKEKEQFLEVENNNNQKSILIFIIFIIALAAINFGRNSIAIQYSPYLSTAFEADPIMISFITNSRSIATLIIGFIAGYLSKKFGHSRTLIVGTSIGIIALIITAITSLLPIIFIGSFLIGAAEVLIYASSYAIASFLIPSRIRAKLFAVYNATFFLSWGIAGTLISGPIIVILIREGAGEVFAYQMAFIIATIICLIGLIVFIFLEIWIKIQNKNNKS